MNPNKLSAGLALAAATWIITAPANAAPGDTEVVSRSSAGASLSGNQLANNASVSGNGRYVAFDSTANDLVAGDTLGRSDVFVHDRVTGTTTRVSVTSAGGEANSDSHQPSISDDGRYVAFFSLASNLTANDTNSDYDVFVHDRQTGTTTCASVITAGNPVAGTSDQARLSPDGRYVAFRSRAKLVAADTNSYDDIYVRDLAANTTTRASLNSSGTAANSSSSLPSISSGGRYVAFESSAANLVTGDTNGRSDVFVRDTQLNATVRASVSSSGAQATQDSWRAVLSADGRKVAFYSAAAELVTGDSNGTYDVFVRDLDAGITARVSVDSAGQQANGYSANASLSADGRYAAFESSATNLVAGDTNTRTDVFVHDLQTGTTTRAGLTDGEAQPTHNSSAPSVSGDGTVVAFVSFATNLDPSGIDLNGTADVFVRDLTAGTTRLVSRRMAPPPATGSGASTTAPRQAVSADGRFVTFHSRAVTLVAGDTNNRFDVFVHDRDTDTTTRVSVSSTGDQANHESFDPSISADGRYVAFESLATNLVAGDGNGTQDVFIHDRVTGITSRVSVDTAGGDPNGVSSWPTLSDDGRYVAFESHASDLVAGDSNGRRDVFVRDRDTGTTTRISVDAVGAQANNDSVFPHITANGRYVGFYSTASNLVPGDTNSQTDVFVRDLQTGAISRASVSDTEAQANYYSFYGSVSADGRYVVFESSATNLVAGDTNGQADIFVRDLQAGTTTRLSVSSAGAQGNSASMMPSLSDDGRFVVFQSDASNLVPGDTIGARDIFIHDRQSGTTTLASADSAGAPANAASFYASISAEGRFVAFSSNASNLVAGDTNANTDVFVHEQDVILDATPPVIIPTVAGPAGLAGWYTGNVAVSWSVTDAESVVSASTGCGAVTVTTDGSQGFTCTATSGGGTASSSVTVLRDATPPPAAATAAPLPNGEGWNDGAVTVTFSGSDATSGIADCSPPELLSVEAAGQSASGTCSDVAGNVSAPATAIGINIDRTAPVASASAAPAPNGSGWNTTAVTVTFTATDNLSGVAAGGCAAPMVLGSDGAGQSASGSCVDRAGNISTPATVAGINVDTAAPVAAVDVDPDANAYGWNNTNVTVSFSGVDAMSGSGIDSCSPAALVSAEGAAQVRNGSCSDVAGNSSATVSASVSLDRTAPTASITTPPAGATYIMGTAVPAAYACSDGLSGIDSCTGPVPNGGNVDTVTAGSKSFVVTATDRAGNAAGSTHAYTVIPPYTFLGFLSPTDNLPTINRVTPGRVIPIKWRLQKPDGSYATDTATLVSLLSAPVACDASPTDLVEEQLTSAGSTVFRYDATENQFIYNWQSAKAWRGCRLLQVNVRDLPPQYAKFEFR